MKIQKANMTKWWNENWNNHICYYSIIKLSMTFCYIIKYDNTKLFYYIMKKICIIILSSIAYKSKYV